MRKLYNRYIPQEALYARVPPRDPGRTGPGSGEGRRGPAGALSGLLGGGGLEGASQALGGFLKRFHLEDLDLGDVLLALIVLLLILEDGDNLDLIITLGLMILFSLGDP